MKKHQLAPAAAIAACVLLIAGCGTAKTAPPKPTAAATPRHPVPTSRTNATPVTLPTRSSPSIPTPDHNVRLVPPTGKPIGKAKVPAPPRLPTFPAPGPHATLPLIPNPSSGQSRPHATAVPQALGGGATTPIMWTVPYSPRPASTVSIYGKLYAGGRPVFGASMRATMITRRLHETSGPVFTTKPDGVAIAVLQLPATVKANTKVLAVVVFSYNGHRYSAKTQATVGT